MNRDQLLSRRRIEGLIADGHLIVIYEGLALKLDKWLDKHPGGHLAIQHMVGRDATDEINAYHFEATLRTMKAFRIGTVALPWINFLPPIRSGVFRPYKPDEKDVELEAVPEETDLLLPEPTAVATKESIDSVATQTCLLSKPEINTAEMTKQEYTSLMENKEKEDGIRSQPSLDIASQLKIAQEYRALHEQIERDGLYACRYSEYGKEALRYLLLFGIFLYLLRAKWYLTSALFLGMFWQQIMFTAHDAGHRAITGNFVIDTLIGAFIADFCCGLSIGWWKSSHNVHHLITNMPEHDPDIQNVPLFATSPAFFRSVTSTFYENFTFHWTPIAEMLVPFQKYTYYPVMGIARFNLYLLSWLHLLSPRSANIGSAKWTRYVELLFMLGYWSIFGYYLLFCVLPTWPIRVGFVLVSHMVTMILHVQITLSHWGMPTTSLGKTECFAQLQLRTTMDVDCPAWLDFLHGGLQFQTLHHLFPRVPRHNLRPLQGLVRSFCAKTGLTYHCYGFREGNEIVLSRLEEVAQMVDTLVKCQAFMAETGESGLKH